MIHATELFVIEENEVAGNSFPYSIIHFRHKVQTHAISRTTCG
jgi:hypothetical protein